MELGRPLKYFPSRVVITNAFISNTYVKAIFLNSCLFLMSLVLHYEAE